MDKTDLLRNKKIYTSEKDQIPKSEEHINAANRTTRHKN